MHSFARSAGGQVQKKASLVIVPISQANADPMKSNSDVDALFVGLHQSRFSAVHSALPHYLLVLREQATTIHFIPFRNRHISASSRRFREPVALYVDGGFWPTSDEFDSHNMGDFNTVHRRGSFCCRNA